MAKRKRATFTTKPPWYKTHWDKIVFLVLIGLFIILVPGQNIYTVNGIQGTPDIRSLSLPIPSPAPYPTNITGVYPGSEVSATGVVVLDANSGVFMYKRNADESLSPASTTKIMTALVSLDSYKLDDVVTVHTVANDGQAMGLFSGEQMTVENLLYGALVYSGNDAAYALAEHYHGGVSAFVAAMNKKAKELHLMHSSFTNPVGYDDPNHKMTAEDLAQLARAALHSEEIAKIVAIPEITVSDVTHTYFYPLSNVNELLGKIPGVAGIKTGWTEEAGENLVTLIERGGHRVIIVVLHSVDRFGDTKKLIDWVFNSYQWMSYSSQSAETAGM